MYGMLFKSRLPAGGEVDSMVDKSFKVIVHFDRREDGGLRAWSDDVPGLLLSHSNVDGIIADVPEALTVILSHMLCRSVAVKPLGNIREALEAKGIVAPAIPLAQREYVATCH
jgi:hypothetical protein